MTKNTDIVAVLTTELGENPNEPGRPSEFDPKYIPMVDDYLKLNQDEWSEFHKTRGEKSDSYERIVKVKLPSREGFAKFIGRSHDALSDWAKANKEFGVALSKINEEQRERLINEGLAGNYNPVVTKLLLSANHGMAERQDLTSNGDKVGGFIYMPAKKPEGDGA